MTEEDKTAAAGSAGTGPVEAGAGTGNAGTAGTADDRPVYEIVGQYLHDLSFENPNAPMVFSQMSGAPRLDVRLSLKTAPLQEDLHETRLIMYGHLKNGDQTAYIVELTYAALTRLRNVPQQNVQPLLAIETPRLVFPEVRRIFRQAVMDGGFPPPAISMVDFVDMYRKNMQRQGEQAAAGDGATAGDLPNLKMDLPEQPR